MVTCGHEFIAMKAITNREPETDAGLRRTGWSGSEETKRRLATDGDDAHGSESGRIERAGGVAPRAALLHVLTIRGSLRGNTATAHGIGLEELEQQGNEGSEADGRGE